ncbi:KamA family radical SAM protein [Clostridia bacterium]|nr:KamA family radical SAM protein [Clostridia bacterium]
MRDINITTAQAVADALGLTNQEKKEIGKVIKQYPMSIPDHYLSLIDKNDPYDPIRKMCLPSIKELSAGGTEDPSGEACNTKLIGVQHKYSPTVLFLATNTCLMYCRYCFRKRMVGLTKQQMIQGFEDAYQYVLAHKEVNNVLISGGDPLTIEASVLAELLDRLVTIKHLDFIRIGSRVPVVDPERISESPALLDVLQGYAKKKPLYLVTHINHPREISDKTCKTLRLIQEMGIVVNNQSVLLRGINDDAKVLIELMRGLTKEHVIPYYLFQCRPVKGAQGHFQVPLIEGIRTVEKAKHHLNGHEKRFRYCMSHSSGKIEVLGQVDNNNMLFKYHEAKEDKNNGRIFHQKITKDQCWI